jgi:hypothetical protein
MATCSLIFGIIGLIEMHCPNLFLFQGGTRGLIHSLLIEETLVEGQDVRGQRKSIGVLEEYLEDFRWVYSIQRVTS